MGDSDRGSDMLNVMEPVVAKARARIPGPVWCVSYTALSHESPFGLWAAQSSTVTTGHQAGSGPGFSYAVLLQ